MNPIYRKKYLANRAEQILKDVQQRKKYLKELIKTVTTDWSYADIINLQQDFISILDQERVAKATREFFKSQLEMLSRV